MKKNIVLLLITFLLFSCEEPAFKYTETQLKAQKIRDTAMTFESIARQPEAATQIIKTSESLLYKSYNDLLPLYDEEIEDSEYVIGAAFGLSFGHFIEAYARQPEAKVTLDSVAEQFLGPFSAGHLSPKLIESAKIEAAPYIFQAIARQPEIFEGINEFCLKYLGVDITGLE